MERISKSAAGRWDSPNIAIIQEISAKLHRVRDAVGVVYFWIDQELVSETAKAGKNVPPWNRISKGRNPCR